MWFTLLSAAAGTFLWWTSRRFAGTAFFARLATMTQVVRLTQKVIEIVSLMGDVASGAARTVPAGLAATRTYAPVYSSPAVTTATTVAEPKGPEGAPEVVRNGLVQVFPDKHYTHTLNSLHKARYRITPDQLREVFLVYRDHLGTEAIRSFKRALSYDHDIVANLDIALGIDGVDAEDYEDVDEDTPQLLRDHIRMLEELEVTS